jgi:phosphate transport system permease protein
MTSPSASAGAPRRRQTRAVVRLGERSAKILISIGGIGTILAVAGILVFLAWVVVPLFLGAKIDRFGADPLANPGSGSALVHAAVDEGGLGGWSLLRDGTLHVWRADSGLTVERRKVFGVDSITASAFPPEIRESALGFADGTVLLPRIGFQSEVLPTSERPELESELGREGRGGVSGEIFQRVPGEQIRVIRLDLDLGQPIETGLAGPIRLLDLSESGSRRFVCALAGPSADVPPSERSAKARLVLLTIERAENLLTGEVSWETSRASLPFEPDPKRGMPEHLLLSGGGDLLYLVWGDGHLARYDLRDPDHAQVVEEVELLDGTGGNGAKLTAIGFLIGKTTIVCGDSSGRVRAFFPTKPPDARASDGIVLAFGHRLCEGGPAIASLAASQRSRVVAAGDVLGGVRLWHVTSTKLLATMAPPSPAEPAEFVEIDPKGDGVLAVHPSGMRRWTVDLRYPEAALASLFAPVWYEGYPKPEHAWQSTGGTDDFEPKLGLVPLVFGTVKATVVSMLFAVPIALLAAIFTSQFLSPKVRSPIKATVEMMASLPSVVLGFLAAIVVAPVAERFVPAVLVAFLSVPFALLLGARAWQLLPARLAVRGSGLPRGLAMGLALLAGFGLAVLAGPAVERLLFAGDLRLWLDHRRGSGIGGWIFLLVAPAAGAVVLLRSRTLDPWLSRASQTWEHGRSARVDVLRFLGACVLAIALAWAGAWVLDGLWLDPRGGVFDTYVQRNALVVGFVMGFAVVPIVYTLAEDALSSVPAHLVLASLGAGATPWQTAFRIVVPTAASGLFSAVMVGLGRAVGETMIVLMATGNTPILSWNVFSGFRTLSANIAVELPEAVRGSTHYRTLFLAGLCLFAITFVFNTAAETVRQRFRKRAFQL